TFGVAERSQHLYGRAIDVTFDSRLAGVQHTARAMKRGGVGWYPNSHFIHLDSGPMRNWELDGGGYDSLLLRPLRPGQILTVRERLARARAFAHQEFLARRR